jgi:hypothetical protein
MDQQPIEIVVTQLLNDIIDQINDEYQNVQTCRQVTIKLDDIAAVEQSPTMLLSARRFLKMHQRVYSDPTVCLRSDRLMDTIEGSSGSRRPNNNKDHHHVVADHLAWFGGESWVDAKNRLTAARLNDFEVSRELERVWRLIMSLYSIVILGKYASLFERDADRCRRTDEMAQYGRTNARSIDITNRAK